MSDATKTPIQPRLYLLTPVLAEADIAAFRETLAAACQAGEVAAVLLRLAPADERTLIAHVKLLAPAAQESGAAVVVADPGGVDLAAVALRGGADGAHSGDAEIVRDLGRRLKEGRVVGAGNLRSKHDAMVAGEAGVDYVLFGEPRPDGFVPPLDLTLERTEWWAEIFQTPCVAFVPDLADVAALAALGPDFIALGDAVWLHPSGVAAGVRDALERMSVAAPEGVA